MAPTDEAGPGPQRDRGGVQGEVAPGFEAVHQAFAAIVAAEASDLCAQVAAYHRGEKVVDLWVGSPPDALMGIYSASKGVTHLVVALLVEEGVLDLDRQVASYWPEFAAEGKGDVSLRQLLCHQAGVVATTDGFTVEELADDRVVAERLAAQRPWWRPGTATGYHALVMAALSGEVVRRATGASPQELFAERVRTPLDLDVHLGLPADEDDRFVPARPLVATPERLQELAAATAAPDSISGRAFNRHHPANREVWDLINVEAVRRLGTASFGGVGTARGLAKLYAAAAGPVEGSGPLLRPDTTAAFGQVQTAGLDLVLRQLKSWALGFHAASEVYPCLGAGAFGHSGAGGQQALVDPGNDLSYAFLRQPFVFPTQADPCHERLLRPLVAAARADR